MDAMARMDQSVKTVTHDLGIVLDRTKRIRRELTRLAGNRPEDVRIERIRELLDDLQARVNGIDAFIRACQKQAHQNQLPAEDIDLWL